MNQWIGRTFYEGQCRATKRRNMRPAGKDFYSVIHIAYIGSDVFSEVLTAQSVCILIGS